MGGCDILRCCNHLVCSRECVVFFFSGLSCGVPTRFHGSITNRQTQFNGDSKTCLEIVFDRLFAMAAASGYMALAVETGLELPVSSDPRYPIAIGNICLPSMVTLSGPGPIPLVKMGAMMVGFYWTRAPTNKQCPVRKVCWYGDTSSLSGQHRLMTSDARSTMCCVLYCAVGAVVDISLPAKPA